MRILITRPAEDGEEIAAALTRLGHHPLLAPLLATHFQDGPEPGLDDVQAILATSANGIRALVRRTARRDRPVFAVGPQTAREAQQNGFAPVHSADGDAAALGRAIPAWAVPEKGALLHVTGSHGAPGDWAASLLAQGYDYRKLVLYDVHAATALPPQVRAALEHKALDAVLFFSPRSARVFCALADGLPRATLIALCISPLTAAALSPGFGQVRIAAHPNQDALLALVE
jgi:uroporphyrinogen-III synthase